jgi:ABC-type protease/lipase transport system fused ATPase/permease subunit
LAYSVALRFAASDHNEGPLKEKLSSPLLNQVRSFLPAYATLLVFSFFCPLLYLASPIYVEQIFDRVMYSRSVNTLLVLCFIATFMLAMYALLEWVRKKALVRIGNAIDERLSRVIFDIAQRSGKGSSRAPSILADFTTVREFLSGTSLTSIFDAIWSPLFIVVMIIVNWLFGVIAVLMVGATALLAIFNHRTSKAAAARPLV